MRIVHISDIHVGKLSLSWRALFDKRLLGTANWLVRRASLFHREYFDRALTEIHRLSPELVVCTGDVTCVSAPREFEMAAKMLEPLRVAFGHRFLFIPGNHDAYVRDAACQKALKECFWKLNSQRWELGDLPLELNQGGLRIFLLNEAAPASWWLSTGRLQPEAAEWLAQRATPRRPLNEQRLLVGHFPVRRADGSLLPARRRLQGGETIDNLLREGRIDLALCGHVHHPFVRREPGGGTEVCAGSLTLNGVLNVVDWHPGEGRFRQFFVDVSQVEPPTSPVGDSVAAVS